MTLHNFEDEMPDRDFYWVLLRIDGITEYHFMTMDKLLQYSILHGYPHIGNWTYDKPAEGLIYD